MAEHAIDGILGYVETFSWGAFTQNGLPTLTGSHRKFLSGLKSLLSEKYPAYNEHYLFKFPFPHLGRLDLYVRDGVEILALEYDTKLHLKYKSVAKLLFSDAKICVGIYGGVAYPQTFNTRLYYDNLRRINQIRKKYHLYKLGKIFYLINLMTKKVKVIYL